MNISSSEYEPEQENENETSNNDAFNPAERSSISQPSTPPLQNLTLSCRHGSPTSKPKPKRRKSRSQNSGTRNRETALRRARSLPIDRYLGLYNESVKDVLNPIAADDGHDISRSSQHGIVTWSAEEKNRFFSALSRKGKDAIPQIAALVGTKTEMEVQQYLQLLHRSYEHHETTGRNLNSVHLLDMPAAHEISDDCNQFLDKVAYAASLREEQEDNVAGRRKHNDMWLVDREIAALVEEQLESKERDNTETDHSIFATARLLNLPKWVELSETVFMNSGKRRLDDNWTNVCLAGETPALTCDALSDFYALAVSITRRLVQSSIFFAASRIRALKPGGWDTKGLVHGNDVRAALSVVKMMPNAFEFWKTAPRRCALDIRARRGRFVGYISYKEAEQKLSYSAKEKGAPWLSSLPQPAPQSEDEEDVDNIFSDDDIASADSDSADAAPASFTQHELSDPEEDYASKMDCNVGREAEKQIWERLDHVPPSFLEEHNGDSGPTPEIKLESDDEQPSHRPVAKRKAKEDLVDWRERIVYQSEWESRKEVEESQHRDKRQKVS